MRNIVDGKDALIYFLVNKLEHDRRMRRSKWMHQQHSMWFALCRKANVKWIRFRFDTFSSGRCELADNNIIINSHCIPCNFTSQQTTHMIFEKAKMPSWTSHSSAFQAFCEISCFFQFVFLFCKLEQQWKEIASQTHSAWQLSEASVCVRGPESFRSCTVWD